MHLFYFLASISLGVFALILGVLGFTDEFRHGTIVSTFLTHTSRRESSSQRHWSPRWLQQR